VKKFTGTFNLNTTVLHCAGVNGKRCAHVFIARFGFFAFVGKDAPVICGECANELRKAGRGKTLATLPKALDKMEKQVATKEAAGPAPVPRAAKLKASSSSLEVLLHGAIT